MDEGPSGGYPPIVGEDGSGADDDGSGARLQFGPDLSIREDLAADEAMRLQIGASIWALPHSR
jgi:hypothetical protein